MISAEEAKDIILRNTNELPEETVSLLDAHERILAVDVQSNDDIPPFRNSSMDGFALRSVDTLGASEHSPKVFDVVGEIAAGEASQQALQTQSATRILTGAPLPIGADAVVQVELVHERDGHILVPMRVASGTNTREKGEDIRKGEVVLRRGTRIKAAQLGVLASMGITSVEVFLKPRMAILTTGNELVPIDQSPTGGKIRNSNAYSLFALAKENDCRPVDLGVAKDEELELVQKIKEGLNHDIVVTSGGISAGKYDFVLQAMKRSGIDLKFWKVNIKPGTPFAFGIFSSSGRSVPVFCLPGNPVSTVVTFLQFVRLCLLAMMGMSYDASVLRLSASLEHDIQKSDGKRHYHRGILESKNGKLSVRSTGSQSSGVLSSLVKANCLIVLEEMKSDYHKGEQVAVELLS